MLAVKLCDQLRHLCRRNWDKKYQDELKFWDQLLLDDIFQRKFPLPRSAKISKGSWNQIRIMNATMKASIQVIVTGLETTATQFVNEHSTIQPNKPNGCAVL